MPPPVAKSTMTLFFTTVSSPPSSVASQRLSEMARTSGASPMSVRAPDTLQSQRMQFFSRSLSKAKCDANTSCNEIRSVTAPPGRASSIDDTSGVTLMSCFEPQPGQVWKTVASGKETRSSQGSLWPLSASITFRRAQNSCGSCCRCQVCGFTNLMASSRKASTAPRASPWQRRRQCTYSAHAPQEARAQAREACSASARRKAGTPAHAATTALAKHVWPILTQPKAAPELIREERKVHDVHTPRHSGGTRTATKRGGDGGAEAEDEMEMALIFAQYLR